MAVGLWPAVHRVMLRGGNSLERLVIVALQVLDKRHCQPPAEVRVLAVRLLAPAPARIAEDVDVRRPERDTLILARFAGAAQSIMELGASLVGDHAGDLPDQVDVPCRAEAGRLRKDGRDPG